MSNPSNTGRFVWFDLMSTNLEASLSFYTELFGWTVTRIPVEGLGDYCLLLQGNAPVGGVIPLKDPRDIPSHWVGYVTVDDLDVAVGKIPELGGWLIVGPTEIPGAGRFAIAADPEGAIFAPFASAGDLPPDSDSPHVGIHCWSELMTPNPEASVKFYEDLLGWTHFVKDASKGKYFVLQREGKDMAGAMELPVDSESIPLWLHYVHAADVDASAQKVRELGGTVSVEPTNLEGLGRFIVVKDNQGAAFALFTPVHA